MLFASVIEVSCVPCRGGRGAQVSRLLALHSYLHGDPASSKPDATQQAAQQAAERKADNEDLAVKVGTNCALLINKPLAWPACCTSKVACHTHCVVCGVLAMH